MGHDARLGPATLRNLLGWRTGNHGSSQSRSARSRRHFHRTEHSASARTAAESLHHARTQHLLPLFLHAEALVRAIGESANRFSRRVRHDGRIVGNADAAADGKTVVASPYSDLRAAVLGQGDQLENHGPSRNSERARNENLEICGYS